MKPNYAIIVCPKHGTNLTAMLHQDGKLGAICLECAQEES